MIHTNRPEGPEGTTTMMDDITTAAVAMLTDMPGGVTVQRVDKLAAVLAAHPDATLATCCDERTGARFGEAKCRRGRAVKIGRSTFRYQLWATWND